jgi:hypothetical protein
MGAPSWATRRCMVRARRLFSSFRQLGQRYSSVWSVAGMRVSSPHRGRIVTENRVTEGGGPPVGLLLSRSCCPTFPSSPHHTGARSPLASHSSPLASHSSPLASHSSPLASHSSPLASHSSPLASHSSPLASHSSPLASHSSPLGPVVRASRKMSNGRSYKGVKWASLRNFRDNSAP